MRRWYRVKVVNEWLGLSAPEGLPIEFKGLAEGHNRQWRRAVKSRAQSNRAFGLTLVLAMLMHMALIFPLIEGLFGTIQPLEPTQVVYRSSSSRVSAEDRLRAEIPRKEREEKKTKENEPDQPPVDGQVVQLPAPEVAEKPTHAQYLSEWDQKTDRETRSRHQTDTFENATRKPERARIKQKDQKPSETTKQNVALIVTKEKGTKGDGRARDGEIGPDADTKKSESTFMLQLPKKSSNSALKLSFRTNGILKNRDAQRETPSPYEALRVAMGRIPTEHNSDERAQTGTGEGQGKRGGDGSTGLPSLMELTPTLADLDWINGMPANDYLPEVETDAETRLNAWRWKHSPFFNRMADGLRRNWEGPEILKARDPTARIYGTNDMNTVLHVSIDPNGNLLSVSVRDSSGVQFFDEEAMRTFRATAPFPNPPTGLFQGRDRFTFDFGFHVSYQTKQIDLDWRPY
jgi:TonB family protein